MINYETYCQIRLFHQERKLTFRQIADELGLDPETVAKYALSPTFPRRKSVPRPSKLEPFKPAIVRWLERHDYTCTQILQRLREAAHTGGFSIVKEYLQRVRPPRKPAFLTLAFAPGEAAQVDWGHAGFLQIGGTKRRLSFFAMVLCHSRFAYLEFTLGQAMEHFLACHQNAFEFFQGVPSAILIDNLKTGVLSHPHGQTALFHPRYLDFAAHHGFQARACNVRKANEKGRVENFVGYVKKNFLAGLELPNNLPALQTAARLWLDNIAHARLHGETRKTPVELFAIEKAALLPLSALPADTSVSREVRVSNRCRVTFETNRYSVPSIYSSQRLTLFAFADRICLYHSHKLIATHPRSYQRHADFQDPDHCKDLLHQRRRARDAQWLLSFYSLSPQAEHYHQQLDARSLNPRVHINKIVALTEIYGTEQVARALEDAIQCHAYSSQYIENILQQRQRPAQNPGPLHLTRHSDLLQLQLPAPDLSLYDQADQQNHPIP